MCLRPVNIYYDDALGRHALQVPCGKCPECLKAYQDSWKVRLCHEFEKYKKAVFFTLTYNEDNVPVKDVWQYFDNETGELIQTENFSLMHDMEKSLYRDDRAIQYKNGKVVRGRDGICRTVFKSDVVNWLKRCRMRLFRSLPDVSFSYYITSEYSPKWLRPHYHGIIFGITQQQFNDYFSHDWNDNFGFSTFSDIVYKLDDNKSPSSVANYVSKYCSKGSYENPRVVEGTVYPTFHLCSKGLGKSWILENLKRLMPEIKPSDLDLSKQKHWYCKRSELIYNEVDFKIKRYETRREITLADGKRVIYRKSQHCALSSPSLKDEVLSALSENFKVPFYNSKSKQTFLYRLPRYYAQFCQAYQPSLYSQIQDYRRLVYSRYVEDELYRLRSDGFSPSEAYLEYDRLEQSKRESRNYAINKHLSDFYKQSKVA